MGTALRIFAAGALLAAFQTSALAVEIEGQVEGPDGQPIVGAMVTVQRGDPILSTTVFAGEEGHFATPDLADGQDWIVRVRRIGWRDVRRPFDPATGPMVVRLEREDDPAALAQQLPANRWFGLLLEKFESDDDREEFVRQCTYCHQQGSLATRIPREDWQWEKVLALMGRMGGTLHPELRAQVPGFFRDAYDPATAVPRLTARMNEPDFAPPPVAAARRAVVDEWELGKRSSMQHDLTVHPDGRVYSVDMTQDELYRLDPETGAMARFPLPSEDLGLGGVGGVRASPLPTTANMRQGPHSLQVAPDGGIWVTLAIGNQLGRFDPVTEEWALHPLEEGLYPHTLRFDEQGRIWFSLAVSNHLGMFDPATNEFTTIRLPAASLGQAVLLRLLPALLWIAQRADVSPNAGEGGGGGDLPVFPVPYGVDVAPDGGIWFSQLNQHLIGRVDPETLEVEMIETPFSAPRRLRFDSGGGLWIPGFSSSVLSRFDIETREFQTWDIPVEPRGTETPYALHVDRSTDTVWICGTNSDSLIRFDPVEESFTFYPLPTRVTYTREIDFDEQGRVWTSNSNMPTWQVEGGFPRVLRLDPREPRTPMSGPTAALGESSR